MRRKSNMQMTKKLEKLLAKYKKANRARLTAYARRSRTLRGTYVEFVDDADPRVTEWKRVFKVPVTEELKAKLDADVEVARLRKLEVSAELRAYCKKKGYHIKWDSSNQIRCVLTHMEWTLRKYPVSATANTLLAVMGQLKLIKTMRHFF
jgi:hypothetical protein